MVTRKALAQAEVRLACVANDATLHSVLRFVAADDAVPLLVDMLGVVIFSKRLFCVWRCSCLHSPSVARVLFQ